jgi:transcriptional repressor NrdR
MKCPYCGNREDKVVDSRPSKSGDAIRRRRECLKCEKRFTTYEQVEDMRPVVVKKDGRRENFDRGKILSGLRKACEKRPIAMEQLEQMVDDIQHDLETRYEKEYPSEVVGELIMQKLYDTDEVAYVRFASVYRQFRDAQAFSQELKKFMSNMNKDE